MSTSVATRPWFRFSDLYTPPNLFTYLRLWLSWLIAKYVTPDAIVTVAIAWWMLCYFAIGSATDYLDGWLARRKGGAWTTALGGILDPIADKALVIIYALFLLRHTNPDIYVQSALWIVIGREVWVFGLRPMLWFLGYLELIAPSRVIILPSPLGKWKLGLQVAALSFCGIPFVGEYRLSYVLLLYALSLASLVTIASAIEYTAPLWYKRMVLDKLPLWFLESCRAFDAWVRRW